MTEDSRHGPDRTISDATTMRALAHPVRLALLEAIRAEGELTASRAAELLDDSPGNMSWHLQTLARYGFVEETGNGKGRSRPWRLARRRVSFQSHAAPDAETRAAGQALEHALVDRTMEKLEQWWAQREAFPEWARRSFISSTTAYLTPEEMGRLADEVTELFLRYGDRSDPEARPADARMVRLFGLGHPENPAAEH